MERIVHRDEHCARVLSDDDRRVADLVLRAEQCRAAHPASTRHATTIPTPRARDCDRIGSLSMRTSLRTSACSIRRTRNRYPLTCHRVVGCAAMFPPPRGARFGSTQYSSLESTLRRTTDRSVWFRYRGGTVDHFRAGRRPYTAAAALMTTVVVAQSVGGRCLLALLAGFRPWAAVVAAAVVGGALFNSRRWPVRGGVDRDCAGPDRHPQTDDRTHHRLPRRERDSRPALDRRPGRRCRRNCFPRRAIGPG